MYIAIKQSFPSLVSLSITHSQRVKSSLGPVNVEHNFQTKFACIFCHSSDKINYSHTKDGLCFGILQTSESAALRRNLDPRRESGNRKRKTTWSWITAFPGVISTQRVSLLHSKHWNPSPCFSQQGSGLSWENNSTEHLKCRLNCGIEHLQAQNSHQGRQVQPSSEKNCPGGVTTDI